MLRSYTPRAPELLLGGGAASLAEFPDEAARPDIVAWCVLGLLLHLLATGRLTSEDAAERLSADVIELTDLVVRTGLGIPV